MSINSDNVEKRIIGDIRQAAQPFSRRWYGARCSSVVREFAGMERDVAPW